MDSGNVDLQFSSERLSHESRETMSCMTNQYQVPADYNPDEHPPVRMRNHTNADRSETQRKRRSKNRLSNRRSTGFVNPEMVDEAMKMGACGTGDSEPK
ncbi:unnamed protein product [Phaedon cochleariae]|uniref:Uncharacterized protein n=1 Tax=Phaedon cochleariae TaxID=80249 RepID=A0A9N9SLK7_PHACE|nr:unnamed protein product [Phaedon cochleariae]